MKIYITIAALFLVSCTIAQKNIEVPTFETVQVDTNPHDYITITIDKKGQMTLEREKIKLSALRAKIFELLYDGIKHNIGLQPLFMTELVVDKDLPYTKLASVLSELRKMNALPVLFACKSDTHQRIPRRKTTGFQYKLPSDENAVSVVETVFKKIESEKKNKSNDTEEAGMIPPPPPPPPSISRECIKANPEKTESKVIVVNHQSFSIDNEEMSASQLTEKFMQWNSKKKVAYILEPTKSATYQDVVTPIAHLLTTLKTIRNKESINLYGKAYDNLDYHKQLEVREKVPFMIVLGE